VEFGKYIRELRKRNDISLREFADRIKMDFTYLSKIENGKVEPPSEDKIRKMAKELAADPEELLVLAGRVTSEQIRKAVENDPRVGILLRKIKTRDLTDQQITEMLKIARGKEGDQGKE
jgi:transcriptional regulator with XRE-family HTH domain